MEWISRNELRRLSVLCDDRLREAAELLESTGASSLEKALASREMEYMNALSEKLDRIAASDAKRIEVCY